MASLIDRPLPQIGWPDHQMCGTRTDFVITAGAPIDLGGVRGGNRPDLVVVAVRAGLDPPSGRQWR